MNKLKTYKLFEEIALKANDMDENDEIEPVGVPPVDNTKVVSAMKEVIENIIKIKHYFRMLCDTTEHVFEIANKAMPKSPKFVEEVYKRDDVLGDLMDELFLAFNDNNSVVFEIEDICETIEKLEEYTGGGNLEILLNKKNELVQEEEDDEEPDENENGI